MGKDRVTLTKQVKEASDIVAVISGYLPLRPAGSVFKGLCPFHDDHRPSFQVDPKWQNYRCWSCGKTGDVFTFIQEFEKVSFLEARALLARRAGVVLDEDDPAAAAKARQLDALRWAAEQYQHCLLESPLGEGARRYLGARRLVGDMVRKFGLGFAPPNGDWLLQRGLERGLAPELLEEVSLVARRQNGPGWYDRFRDRVMFPVRNASGQVVGFGGRILPESPLAERAPKYYNSAETPLFSKSDLLYGLDMARHAAASVKYLAIVEGYTDVMMAHQMGVPQVVATMGTALTARHVQQLRRFVPRIVLVYDADEGGSTGVDRALEIFVSHEIDLAVATLPEGLDPCDLLLAQGAEPFKHALETAADALDFKMNQMLAKEASTGIEGQRRVIDAVLGVIALAPEAADKSVQMKRELIVTRIAHRLGVREATVWSRLGELRNAARRNEPAEVRAEPKARAPRHERELLELLLAEPKLVAQAMQDIAIEEITHEEARRLLAALYDVQRAGDLPDLDALRTHLTDERLSHAAQRLWDLGRQSTADRGNWYQQLVATFISRRDAGKKQELKSRISAAADYQTELELLRRLQSDTVDPGQAKGPVQGLDAPQRDPVT